ncbi:MAG: 1-deoxy-D-xylulose-5-phosphate reductoisomerase [Candidatus Cloacimonadaceae bacterium]|nr:1-deoxy-D-xylulose-5-phosphate reductoisomerase [Candidatus Cloacimonadaceae bacterium]
MVGKKKLALLGATGSIGTSVLAVLEEQSEHFSFAFLSANSDHKKLCRIALRYQVPILVLTGIKDKAEQESIRMEHPDLNIYFGGDELIRCLENEDYDIALNAISGSAGLRSTFAVLNRGKTLALANKESLVMAGHLVEKLKQERQVIILPVDSEHSALFQAIGNHSASEIRKLHITASGGAFRELPLKDFDQITIAQALKHPNWDMGAKVTIDSATMFNKALEVMEARWLFGLDYERISALIHPQSVIHSMVEFIDGSCLAQLSVPDMKLPILYALSYPQRYPSELVKTDFLTLSALTFSPIEKERYPLFHLGLEIAREGGILPTVLNSANEAALQLFMQEKIAFKDIHRVVEMAVQTYQNVSDPDLETIIRTNNEVFFRVCKSYS